MSISIIIYEYVTQSPEKCIYAVSVLYWSQQGVFFQPEVERKINHSETLMSFPNITRAYKYWVSYY